VGAYPLFDRNVPPDIGGMEVRSSLFARGLARRGTWDVWFLVGDHGQPARQRIGDVTVAVYPSHRFAHQTFEPHVNALYKEIAADVYVGFGVNWLSAEVVRSSRRFGVKAVLCAASEVDFDEQYRAGSSHRNLGGEFGNACHHAITRADRLVVQTDRQQSLAADRFGVGASVIRNPIELPRRSKRRPPPDPRRQYMLWVGRSDALKRPLLALELARRLPEVPFLLVMNRSDAAMHEEVERRVLPNVLITDRIPFDQMSRLFRDAAGFVNTSLMEGFPNVFLQAGAHGVPVMSLQADPDDLLRSGGGRVAGGDLDRLAGDIAAVWADASAADAERRHLWQHLHANHDLDGRVDELDATLRDVLADVPRRRSQTAA
jgi:glycosyltransferase involved in cell wall biosynthesis